MFILSFFCKLGLPTTLISDFISALYIIAVNKKVIMYIIMIILHGNNYRRVLITDSSLCDHSLFSSDKSLQTKQGH